MLMGKIDFTYDTYNIYLYLNSRFTPDQLNEIRKASMSRILCDNLINSEEDTAFIQPLAFMKDNPKFNQLTSCSDENSIPIVEFRVFRQEGESEPSINDELFDYWVVRHVSSATQWMTVTIKNLFFQKIEIYGRGTCFTSIKMNHIYNDIAKKSLLLSMVSVNATYFLLCKNI